MIREEKLGRRVVPLKKSVTMMYYERILLFKKSCHVGIFHPVCVQIDLISFSCQGPEGSHTMALDGRRNLCLGCPGQEAGKDVSRTDS